MKALPGLLLLLLPFGSAGAQAPLVTIAGGNTVDLCAGCEHPQIRVTVTPAPKFRPKENPIVAEVSVGTLRDGDLQRAFEAKWEKGSDNYPVALILNVDAAKVTRAATYSVILDLQPVTQPGAPRLTLQVQHPAAQLQVPSRLIIDRVCGSADDKQDLYIGEVLGRSAISDLQVSPALQPSVLGNQPVTGQLRIAKGIEWEDC